MDLRTAYWAAVLSRASYLDLSGVTEPGDLGSDLSQRGFNETLAFDLANRWQLLDHHPNTGLSGFSASVFGGLDAHSNLTAERVLAIRGTELSLLPDPGLDLRDIVVDLGLVAGLNPQASALDAYYDDLRERGVLGSEHALTVTGHSLGGLLAQTFSAAHPHAVSQALTFNAPGLSALSPEALNALGVGDITGVDQRTTNFFAEAGAEVLSALGTHLGARVPVVIEQPGIFANAFGHGIRPLVDSLLVQELFGGADQVLRTAEPRIALSETGPILDAITSDDSRLLETAVEALGAWYGGVDAGQPDDPAALYAAALDMRARFLHPDDGGVVTALPPFADARLVSLVGVDAMVIAAEAAAETSLGAAYRHALLALDPFTLTSVEVPQGPDTFAPGWLGARADMLAAMTRANIADHTTGGGLPWDQAGDSDIRFHDVATNVEVVSGPSAGQHPRVRGVVFGAANVTATGGDGDDLIFGPPAGTDSTLVGRGGADVLFGGPGDDVLHGGWLHDARDGAPDRLAGGDGDDTYVVAAGDTIVDTDGRGRVLLTRAGGGVFDLAQEDWQFSSGTSAVSVYRAAGPETLWAAWDHDSGALRIGGVDVEQFSNGDFNIVLQEASVPAPVSNRIDGSVDADALVGTVDDDIIEARDGDDLVAGGPGNDQINSGTGSDLVLAGEGDDSVDGDSGNDVLYGDAGNDALRGGDGSDVISGGEGADLALGGASDDVLTGGAGSDVLRGGDGNDLIVANASALLHFFDPAQAAWSAVRNDGSAARDPRDYTLTGFASGFLDQLASPQSTDLSRGTLLGEDGHDDLIGGRGNDDIRGGAGNDAALGVAGNDVLSGGSGDDHLQGNAGDDVIDGGDGDDLLIGYGVLDEGFDGADHIRGGAGNDRIFGERDGEMLIAGNDTLYGDGGDDEIVGNLGHDVLHGGAGADTLFGDQVGESAADGDDELDGGDGEDELFGGGGFDLLRGGAGDDELYGGGGNDTLIGGTGNDVLEGGDGDDVYHLARGDGHDRIVDDGGIDSVRWGAGIDAGALAPAQVGTGLKIDLGDGDSVFFDRWFTDPMARVEVFLFDDGTLIGPHALAAQLAPMAPPPPVDISPDAPFTRDLETLLGDRVPAGAMLEAIGTADGEPLPDWLVFDSATGTFSGTPGPDAVGVYPLEIMAVLPGGVTSSIAFELAVVSPRSAGGVIHGNSGAQQLVGHADADVVLAGGGDDLVLARAGDDTVHAGSGNDRVDGGDGDDVLYGESGHDQIDAGAGNNTVFGGFHDDVVIAGNGDDRILGEHGHDEVIAGDGDNTVDGGSGNDHVISGSGNDRVLGGDGDDTLLTGSGDDHVEGGGGRDHIDAGAGNNTINGGYHDDTVVVGDGDNVINAHHGDDEVTAGDGHNRIDGGPGNDILRTGLGDNIVDGGDGDDHIESAAGSDTIDGGSGSDTINAGDGNNLVTGGHHNDRITTGAGDDRLDGGFGHDVIDAGDGDNHVSGGSGDDRISAGSGADQISAADGNDVIESGAGDDHVDGGSGADRIDAGDGDNVVFGGFHNDTIVSGSGDDHLAGGQGDDVLDAGAGHNVLFGGEGRDTLVSGAGDDVLDGGDDADLIASGAGNDRINGGGGDDIIDAGDGNNAIEGGDGGDQIRAGGGDDHVDSGWGDDRVDTGAGDDTILTGPGADRILAGAGDDFIDGGAGGDLIETGTGRDVVVAGGGNDQVIVDSDVATVDLGAGNDVIEIGPGARDVVVSDGGGLADVARVMHPAVTPNDVSFARDGDALRIALGQDAGQLVVDTWYRDHLSRIDRIELDTGHYASAVAVDTLIAAMAAFDVVPAADGSGYGSVPPEFEAVLAETWSMV